MQGRSIVVVVFLLMAWWAWISTRSDNITAVSSSVAAPDFTWQAFDGTTHTLKELSGHVVVLHFWASWCEPCRDEFPKLLKAASANKDVIFLAISGDEDKQKAEQFIRQSQAASGTKKLPNMLYAFDPQKTITFNLFQTVQYPESVLLDAGLHMRQKFPGPVDWGSEDIQSILKQLK